MESLLLALCLSWGDRINLAGPATPMAAWQVQPDMIWLVRQQEGGLPDWWLVQGHQAYPVAKMPGLRFAHPTPDGRALVMLVDGEMVLWGPGSSDGKGRILWRTPIDASLGTSEPWRHLTIAVDRDNLLGAFQHRDTHWAWHLSQASPRVLTWYRRAGRLPTNSDPQTASGLSDFRTVNPEIDDGRLAWLEGETFRVWSPKDDQLDSYPLPKTANMEVAVPLPHRRGQPFWLVYGGQRGSFASFGWRLLEADGDQAYSGKGIVVRYGWDRASRAPRLLIFTVSNQIQSQLWASLRGTTTFTCRVLIRDQDRWRQGAAHDIPISKDKSKDRKAIVFHWKSDWNGDGWTDLLVSDAKRGMRLYLSQANGDLQAKPQTVGKAPMRLLPTQIGALAAEPKGNDWHLEAVSWRR